MNTGNVRVRVVKDKNSPKILETIAERSLWDRIVGSWYALIRNKQSPPNEEN